MLNRYTENDSDDFLNDIEEIDKRISELETLKEIKDKLLNATERLSASEDKIKFATSEITQIINNCNEGICVINKNFHILRTNETFNKHVSQSNASSLTGEKCFQVCPNQYCNTINCPVTQITGGAKKVELEILCKDETGATQYYLVTASPFHGFNQKLIGVVATYRNITEHKMVLEKLRLSSEKFRKAMAGTIDALKVTVERRDPYTAGHQQGVANLATNIAKEMGLPKDTIDGIFFAGTIHDLGKISVPIEILCKPGKITKYEFDIIKIHPQIGYEILHPIEFPWPIDQIVLQHHEKIDGSGYPLGVTGNNILLEAKILCVADVVEAMANHRPYRAGLGIEKALEEISRNKGILYDEEVVEACIKVFTKNKFTFK